MKGRSLLAAAALVLKLWHFSGELTAHSEGVGEIRHAEVEIRAESEQEEKEQFETEEESLDEMYKRRLLDEWEEQGLI